MAKKLKYSDIYQGWKSVYINDQKILKMFENPLLVNHAKNRPEGKSIIESAKNDVEHAMSHKTNLQFNIDKFLSEGVSKKEINDGLALLDNIIKVGNEIVSILDS